jgi:SAM-dependent methyltransferase
MNPSLSEINYSKIVNADDYNRMMSKEHLYIAEADQVIKTIVQRQVERLGRSTEILEIGSGPLRLTPLLAEIPQTHVTALDHDAGWMTFSKALIEKERLPIRLVCADIRDYRHPNPIDIVVSQGTHHHLKKGESTKRALQNIHDQLSPHGILIISDEMLSHYSSPDERLIRVCLWYAQIIYAALESGYEQLAVAEMETLLDDLFEGSGIASTKSKAQMRLLRETVPDIAIASKQGNLIEAEHRSQFLLQELKNLQNVANSLSPPLSRGDYKICFQAFIQETQEAGFSPREIKTIGPIETIGGFGIFTLERL